MVGLGTTLDDIIYLIVGKSLRDGEMSEHRGNRLEGKVAVITGGGSGIGRAGSILFAREGCRVTVADIDQHRAEKIASAIQRPPARSDP